MLLPPIRRFWEVLTVFLTIGVALMFAPYSAAHVVSCLAFFLTMIWAAVGEIDRMQRVTKWTAIVCARTAAALTFAFLVMPMMIWFAWPTEAQTPAADRFVQQDNQGAPNIGVFGNGNKINLNDDRLPAVPPSPKYGSHSVVIGHVPSGLSVGKDSVVIGPTDANGNTIIGPMIVGHGAHGCPGDTVIGSNASANWRCAAPSAKGG